MFSLIKDEGYGREDD